MAKFLNTDGLNEWIPKLIKSSEKELIIIVPYIKTSDRIFYHLDEANKNGVEITLIYRENKLNDSEKNKLYGLDNLNLFHHPNVHAKCYYNQNFLIICSMNLYEFSERNNREMGILLHNIDIHDDVKDFSYNDNDTIFSDAIDEIRTIINSSTLEKKSRETLEQGFELEIIKTQKEQEEELCKKLNRNFGHKKFEPIQVNKNWYSVCKNYYDRIDVYYKHRLELCINLDEDRVEEIFNRLMPYYHEYKFEGFKFYWNYYKSNIYLYINRKHRMWNNLTDDEEMQFEKRGLDELIIFLRQFF